jgi:hypothetical protein
MEEQQEIIEPTLPPTEKLEKEKPFNIIDFFGLTKEEYDEEKVAAKIENKFSAMGTTLLQMKEALSRTVQNRAEEFVLEFVNIAPLGDYSNLLEDNDSMAQFLREEAHQVKHWQLVQILVNDVKKELLSFIFNNKAVDDGTNFQGFVFVSKAGKIKHTFAQIEL